MNLERDVFLDNREIQRILSLCKEEMTLDELLEQLELDLNDKNRVILTSKLQWDKEIIRIYKQLQGRVYTFYKLKIVNE